MRILILGAGGIGGYYGGRLAAAGADVTFLVRDPRAALLREGGLVIESPSGDDRIDPQVVTRETIRGDYDLVLLSCKAYDLDSAIVAIEPAVGERTAVLPLLNGVAHLDVLDRAFGAARVLGGVAHISVTLGDGGTIRHLNTLDSLTFGERDAAAASGRCDAIEAVFGKARFHTKRSAIVVQEMWEKFAFITAASGITGLLRANVAEIMATNDGERLTREMVEECAAVAAAEGFPPRPQAKAWGLAVLTKPSGFTASMLRDLESGRHVEAAHLQGDMIARGERQGVATGLLAVAYCHLQAYANRRAATFR